MLEAALQSHPQQIIQAALLALVILLAALLSLIYAERK
jgi:hypothetical protein